MLPQLGLNHSQSTPVHQQLLLGSSKETSTFAGTQNLINQHLNRGMGASQALGNISPVPQAVHPLLAVQTQLNMLKSQLTEAGAESNPAKHRWFLGVLEGGLDGLQHQLEKGLVLSNPPAEKKPKTHQYKEWRRDLIYIQERKAKKMAAEYSERQQAKIQAEIQANPIPGLNPLSFVSKQIR